MWYRMVAVAVWWLRWLSLNLAAGSLAWTGRDKEGLAFQEENQLTARSHASLLLRPASPTSPSTSDLSVCLWLKVLHFRETTTYVFSYATTDKDNNELNFAIKSKQIFIAVGGSYVYGSMRPESYVTDQWYHICFVTDSANATAIFYVNGLVLRKVRLSRRNILLNGSLVLGQESDLVGGGFVPEQSFSGLITAFNLYSRSLSAEEVQALAECGGSGQEGDLVGWNSAEWILAGPVTHKDLPSDYCTPHKFRFVVFSKQRTSDENKDLCRKLKSSVAIPGNEKDNSLLYEAVFPFKDQCQPHNYASAFFFLGAVGTPRERKWIDYEGVTLNYTNFESTSTSRARRCVGFMVPPYKGKWTDISCKSTYKFCAACHKQQPIILKMRGLCEHDLQATYFRLESKVGQVPSLRGFTKYHISRDLNITWSLVNVWTGDLIATSIVHDLEIPLGRREWLVATDFVLCGKSEGVTHVLSLSACLDDEYICGDGTCISLTQRCDLRVDCPDNTDETGCDKLLLPAEYLQDLPPPAPQPGPLLLDLTVSVQGFSEVDIRNMKMTVDFWTVITWYDQRLMYQNLKNFTELNVIKEDSVWTPVVDLVNADFPNTHTTTATLTVIRTSPPEPDEARRPQHDELFEGGKNPLRRSQKVSAPIFCTMDLRMFPFDSQQCQLLLRLSSVNQEFLEWQNLTVEYLGEVLLTEYEVGAVQGSRGHGGGYTQATITINFQRRYSYYLTSTYFPTIMLMLIGYASLFCQLDNADLRVMMALTTLLVLFALYQQISDGLPRTSYITAIDVWCFFAITYIFSQVILHVVIDVRLPCLNLLSSSSKMESGSNSLVIITARIFYAVILILFCFVYWGLVLI